MARANQREKRMIRFCNGREAQAGCVVLFDAMYVGCLSGRKGYLCRREGGGRTN
jgi:hypothetical protein